MKRKDLEELGLTKEALEKAGLDTDVIDGIMDLHGKGVEKAKGNPKTYEDQIAALQKQLDDATKQIESFANAKSPDEVAKEIKDWKTKLDEATKQHNAQVEALRMEHALVDTLREKYNVRNPKAVMALLDRDAIKFESKTATFAGLDEQIKGNEEGGVKGLMQTDEYLFETPTDDKKPKFSESKQLKPTATPETFRDAISQRLSAQPKKE